jgi:hypothetical protein
LDLFVVELAGKIDVAIGGDQGLRIEAVVSIGSNLGRHFASGGEYSRGQVSSTCDLRSSGTEEHSGEEGPARVKVTR